MPLAVITKQSSDFGTQLPTSGKFREMTNARPMDKPFRTPQNPPLSKNRRTWPTQAPSRPLRPAIQSAVLYVPFPFMPPRSNNRSEMLKMTDNQKSFLFFRKKRNAG
jgi:hypothetical protein